jgi:hypothetical protein
MRAPGKRGSNLLLVPSAESLAAPPPRLDATTVDHFQCYHVTQGRTRARNIPIVDGLGSLTLDVKRPRRLCVPVDANGTAPGAGGRTAVLACYDARLASTSRPFIGPNRLFVANEFGDWSFQGLRPAELCVPSVAQ